LRCINAFLIHQLKPRLKLKHLLEALEVAGSRDRGEKMLDDDHVKVMFSHTIEQ